MVAINVAAGISWIDKDSVVGLLLDTSYYVIAGSAAAVVFAMFLLT